MKNNYKIKTFPTGHLGCNTSIIYDAKTLEAVIIDPGEESDLILSMIKDMNFNVQYLLHTHAHYDHITASGCLKKILNIPIFLHKDDAELYKNIYLQGFMLNKAVIEPGIIDEYFDDNRVFKMSENHDEVLLKTIHTPGHSKGGCCFFTEITGKPVLFSGDTLFAGSIGRTDLPGGSYNDIMNSIFKKLLILPDETLVIPGHGEFTTIKKEKLSNPFILENRNSF
ncbi:MAG: beta-lactamase-like protein [uncultured bacterium]|nr:MAG: beta-lactamase-like protein [uncultured bacterium]